MKRLACLLPAIAALSLGGCLQPLSMVAGMKSGSHDGASARKAADPLTLNFERDRRCDSESSYAYNVESRKNAADKIRYAMCHKSPHGDAYDVLNEKLLAGPYDHVEAAVAVIMCVGHGKCEYRGPRPAYESSCMSGHCTYSPSKTTEFAMYANRTTVDDVRRAIEAVDLPADFKSGFVTRYEACRNHVLDAVAQLDPRRKAIYVDTIAAARKRRQEDDAIAAPFKTRVVAL